MNISKTIINNVILIFILTVLFLSIGFVFYYASPHNYTLYELNKKINKKISTQILSIEPTKQLELKYINYNNKLLKLTREQDDIVNTESDKSICTIITNVFKSENIKIDPYNLILLKNSDLIIKNNTNNTMKIILEIYALPVLL